MKNISTVCLLLFVFFSLSMNTMANAEEIKGLVSGQTVYVPAYSHIYIGNKETPYLLTITLSIRNIDPVNPITITQVNYYESQGKFLKELMSEPVVLAPMASTRYIIPQKDKTGGSGGNFIVKWECEQACNPPIIESIMIGTQSQQGISFTSRGRALRD